MLIYTKYRARLEKYDKLNLIVENREFLNAISIGFEYWDHLTKLKEKMVQILTSDENVEL